MFETNKCCFVSLCHKPVLAGEDRCWAGRSKWRGVLVTNLPGACRGGSCCRPAGRFEPQRAALTRSHSLQAGNRRGRTNHQNKSSWRCEVLLVFIAALIEPLLILSAITQLIGCPVNQASRPPINVYIRPDLWSITGRMNREPVNKVYSTVVLGRAVQVSGL